MGKRQAAQPFILVAACFLFVVEKVELHSDILCVRAWSSGACTWWIVLCAIDETFSSVVCNGIWKLLRNTVIEQFLNVLLKYVRTFKTCNVATFFLKDNGYNSVYQLGTKTLILSSNFLKPHYLLSYFDQTEDSEFATVLWSDILIFLNYLILFWK